ncbi:DUF1396 domain-containing protein [Streptomyces sp. GESEQ-4]|uniref:DUF1396 domain-containing protein n=1 Tax=Streptomyces sp. GESEQ-4 TaxID=2812655 RepID=UPI001B342001|nr:DUF1396 domain-containing protein [Streptomyces sp. GESEQ-4]
MKTAVRRSVRGRATGAGLAALLLAGGAVGCGTEQSPEMTPVAAVAKAAEKTEKITSLSYRMRGEVPSDGRVEAEAVMRMEPTAMSMKIRMPDDPEVKGAVEMRIVGKSLYIGGEAMAGQMDGKSWMKIDAPKSGGGEHRLGAETAGLAQAERNPAAESAFLTGADDVTEVGTETVDGVKTTHYKGTLTLDDMRDSLKDEDKKTRERREKSLEQYEDMGVDKLTMDMWVDGEDHTKQFRMRGDADKGTLDMTVTFSDLNEPVTVQAPPAKDTMDFGDMMKELGQA